MRMKFKHIIVYLSLLIFIGLSLSSCINTVNRGVDADGKEIDKFYIDSFDYEIAENESEVANELSYSLSFEIGISISEKSISRDFTVNLQQESFAGKSFKVTIDYCNTENITFSQYTEVHPIAVLRYSIPTDVNSLKVVAKLKITTPDLMDDINKFLSIYCSSDDAREFIDANNLTEANAFKMKYSSDTGFYYEYDEFRESYKIVSIITKAKSVVIPSTYNNHPVSSIDKGSLKALTEIKELKIPSSITYLPAALLNGLNQLESLTMPYIGTSLEDSKHLGYFFVDDSFGQFTTDGYATHVPNSLKEVTITSGTQVGDYVFSGCRNITSITLSDSITSIGTYCFSDCSGLENFILPDSILSIGDAAFYGCSNLKCNAYENGYYLGSKTNPYFCLLKIKDVTKKSCVINDAVEIIYNEAFYNYTHITIASIPALVIPYFPKAELEEVIITSGTTIKEHAFLNCTELRSITISDSITNIEVSSFYNCKNIKKAVIPITALPYIPKDSLEEVVITSGESIGVNDFRSCDHLVSITIPESITTIDHYAFYYCNTIEKATLPATALHYIPRTNLKEIIITSGNTIEENSLSGCNTLTSVTIPNSVTSIEDSAFADCSNLSSIALPSSLVSIGTYAFSECSFSSFIFPNTLTSIKEYAFKNCENLESIILPDGITSIEEGTFFGCRSLSNITIPESITSIGMGAFSGCSNLTEIILPTGITTIEDNTFSGCDKLSNITIPNGVTAIGASAFFHCEKLTNVEFPMQIASIGASAFEDCKLLSITISDTIESIGAYAFYNCPIEHATIPALAIPYISKVYLEDITITSGESIENDAFAYFGMFENKLSHVTILEGITSIGDRAFENCYNLVSITIPNSVTWMGYNVFDLCPIKQATIPALAIRYIANESLEEVIITSGESIQSDAFSHCRNLRSITISDSITSIGDNAFSSCRSLRSITISDSITSIGDNAFSNCPIEYATIPALAITYLSKDTIKEVILTSGDTIEYRAFYGCNSLVSVVIPKSVTSIKEYSFYNCNSLLYIFYEGSAEDWYKVKLEGFNENLTPGKIFYYSENKPATSGDYWHYVDGVATKW